MVGVTTGGRIHFGFDNLSLSHERLYGALGVALEQPRTTLEATATDVIRVKVSSDIPDRTEQDTRQYVERVCELLGVPGATVRVTEALPRHAGLGSGTVLALSTLVAISQTYGRAPKTRERAPMLGRGGRSGIGVGAFERGGFIFDAGHPTARFTTDRPCDGDWTVPAVVASHSIPDEWQFLLVNPDIEAGRSGNEEERSMRTAIEEAEPGPADRISGVIIRRLLPSVVEARVSDFGAAVAEIGRLNGSWYTDEQGGVYRPPIGEIIASVSESAAIHGAGQSSWGPTIYGVTSTQQAQMAKEAGQAALEAAGVGGDVRVVDGRNRGAQVVPSDD